MGWSEICQVGMGLNWYGMFFMVMMLSSQQHRWLTQIISPFSLFSCADDHHDSAVCRAVLSHTLNRQTIPWHSYGRRDIKNYWQNPSGMFVSQNITSASSFDLFFWLSSACHSPVSKTSHIPYATL
jgi:hypothetical protein